MKKINRFICLLRGVIFLRGAFFSKVYRIFLGRESKIINTRYVEFKGNANIGTRCWIECIASYGQKKFSPNITIGNGFSCGDGVHLGAVNKVLIGDDVLLGSYILISDHSHGIYKTNISSHPSTKPIDRELSLGSVEIGDRVWIGDGVKIIGDVRIGSGSVIGAGSIVTKDIPENVIVCGSPAKVVKHWSEESGKWVR